jgi:hypothetical protein
MDISIEKLEQKKRAGQIGFIITFALWQIGQIGTTYFSNELSESMSLMFSLIFLVGSFAWVGYCWFTVKMANQLKLHPKLRKQLYDERICELRAKALNIGFVTAIATSAFFVAANLIVSSTSLFEMPYLNGGLVAHSTLVIIILVTSIYYLWLDSE